MAEGDKESIEDLISKLKEGPRLARVENVDVTWEDYTGEFSEFRVTYADFF